MKKRRYNHKLAEFIEEEINYYVFDYETNSIASLWKTKEEAEQHKIQLLDAEVYNISNINK
jgi:hypothetical protein